MSLVLIREIDKVEHPMYFGRKVLKSAHKRYQKIKNLSMFFVIMVRKLLSYFQGHKMSQGEASSPKVKKNFLAKFTLLVDEEVP